MNTAGVRQYESDTNTGVRYIYTPQNNIDPNNPRTPNIARVDDSGAVTTFAAGTTTLIARFRGLVDSATVEVGVPTPGFGYFYSGDAFIDDSDYYDEFEHRFHLSVRPS